MNLGKKTHSQKARDTCLNIFHKEVPPAVLAKSRTGTPDHLLVSVPKRAGIKKFNIQLKINNTVHNIPHNKIVKYLGVQLDYLLRLNKYILAQLQKAKDTFRSLSRLFYSKSLSHKAKIIYYLLLIRPILSYAIPIWWNVSASMMENHGRFERSCLRACLYIYRKPDDKHCISNTILYEKANIPRIDNFLIKLTRDYFAKLPHIDNKHLK